MENNTFNVAVLGAGNIGSAVVARLMDLDKGIVGLNVKKVLVKDKTKKRDFSSDILTDSFDDILNDDSIDLVIEVLGGVDPGKEYISALLEKGKAVITANKDIIADAGVDLILFETMGNIIEINCALNIAKNYELPKWLSIIFDDYCNLLDGTNIENLFARIDKKSLECLLINCNTKKLTLEGLKKIRRIWSGSIGAYPNLGLTNYKNDYFKVIDKISFLRFLKGILKSGL